MPKILPTHTYAPEHDLDNPDSAVGDYFVSVTDAGRYGLLLGPYPTHAGALARVEAVRTLAEKVDDRAWFYAYGTCRLAPGSGQVGKLNKLYQKEGEV
jgi:hypothetical protein